MADNQLATTNNGEMTAANAPALNLKGLNLKQIYFIGEHMARSGMFTDVRDSSMALVKILAGQEIGVTPFQAMTNIHIIQGKATMSANLMAAKLKGSGKYDYKLDLSSDSAKVTILNIEPATGHKEEAGSYTFTMRDAERAQLVKPNSGWTKYPQNMLFARAISTAVRLYAPDVLNGNTVYSPDEMGADVDDTGNYIEGPAVEDKPQPKTAPKVEVTPEPVTDNSPVEQASVDEPSDTEAVLDLMTDQPTPDTTDVPAIEDDGLNDLKLSELIETLKAEFAEQEVTETSDKLEFCAEVIGKQRPSSKDDYIKVIRALRSS